MTTEPVRIDSSAVVKVEREPLFYIDDDEYTIPTKVPAGLVVRYLNDVYDRGEEYALAAAMRELLGDDAMVALGESDSVSDEHMEQIFGIVERKMMGAASKSMGKSRSGRARPRG